MAIAIPERFVIRTEIDENRQSFEPARRFDLEGGLSIGDRKDQVLVCYSCLPESRSGGTVTTIRWPLLPVNRVNLLSCWLLVLGHESINLKIDDIARRITRARVREGKNFAWYGFCLGRIIADPSLIESPATIKGIGIFPNLPPWKTTFRVATVETHLTRLILQARARRRESKGRAA